jgi:hypothetical protein
MQTETHRSSRELFVTVMQLDKFGKYQQIVVKLPNTEFYGNTRKFNRSRGFTRTGGQICTGNLIGLSLQLFVANSPKQK